MSVLMGCIADDLTGASDLASFLVAAGMRTVLFVGVPEHGEVPEGTEAVVIALKSRALLAGDAVAVSLQALDWLRAQGCEQYYFKYCSTFDSTPEGNIGPVLDALMTRLNTSFTLACPALPVNGRTQYHGYLFVHGKLLNESGMEHHPLTPMTDANLVRVLASQATGPVDLITIDTVRRGRDAVIRRMQTLERAGTRYALVDAIDQQDLLTIGQAAVELPLVSGGSGLAGGLAHYYGTAGRLAGSATALDLATVPGDSVVLAGSCSTATREQVSQFQRTHASLKLDPVALHDQRQSVPKILDWFMDHCHQGPVMIYASDYPEVIKANQRILGSVDASHLIEETMGALSVELSRLEVRKFIVAGGETSGAVIRALNPRGLLIGRSIAPGVPLMQTLDQKPSLVALKSGNFGDPDFFITAVEMMT